MLPRIQISVKLRRTLILILKTMRPHGILSAANQCLDNGIRLPLKQGNFGVVIRQSAMKNTKSSHFMNCRRAIIIHSQTPGESMHADNMVLCHTSSKPRLTSAETCLGKAFLSSLDPSKQLIRMGGSSPSFLLPQESGGQRRSANNQQTEQPYRKYLSAIAQWYGIVCWSRMTAHSKE